MWQLPLRNFRLLSATAIVLVLQDEDYDGMPSIKVSEIAHPRLDVISLFLVVLLASSAAVWGLWNWLRSDFPRLPRLSYAKACGLVTLWGMFFIVVLTMISGARELMTPGAWERVGYTHQLRAVPQEAARKEQGASDAIGHVEEAP